MQIHPCVICKKDSANGGSLVHEGMFFKLCKDCLEDSQNVKLLDEYLMDIEMEEEQGNGLCPQDCPLDLV